MINKIFNKGLLHWFPTYCFQQFYGREKIEFNGPTHIMLCITDHFEPFNDGANIQEAKDRVQTWVSKYPQLADKYIDADGKPVQHVWFYPPHLDHRFLDDLMILCNNGYGEIEMHLHHNHMEPFPDTSDTLRGKIEKCIFDYSKYGIFCLPDGTHKFAFIHGDWSLDNAGGPLICGVNNEILILKEMGCFADFTFPSVNRCQPIMFNEIYYCKDDPDRPKSYNTGIPVVAREKPFDVDLMIITGPVGIRLKRKGRILLPAIESGSFGHLNIPTPDRIDTWIKCNIHVKGRPDWIFVKIHTHGAPESNHDVNFGQLANSFYQYFCNRYNDEVNYFLHFVTAREMYNIIKAAEAGCEGNPNRYRNFLIPPYVYK